MFVCKYQRDRDEHNKCIKYTIHTVKRKLKKEREKDGNKERKEVENNGNIALIHWREQTHIQ